MTTADLVAAVLSFGYVAAAIVRGVAGWRQKFLRRHYWKSVPTCLGLALVVGWAAFADQTTATLTWGRILALINIRYVFIGPALTSMKTRVVYERPDAK